MRAPVARTLLLAGRNWWLLLFGIPIGFYFGLVAAFGVNIVFEDSWNATVLMLGAFANGHLSFGILWAPHNENRMLFPKLLFLLTDIPSRYNATVDLYLSAAFMTLALLFLARLVWRTTGLNGLWLVPISFLFLDPVQSENILWDFQLAWTLIALLCVSCLLLIEESEKHKFLWLLAGTLAVIASYSSLQGLLVWPVGILFAWTRGRSRRAIVRWGVTGVVVVGIYVWHLGNVEPKAWSIFPWHHPLAVARFFLIGLGNWVPHFHTVTGAGVLAGLGVVALVAIIRPDWRKSLGAPLALAVFAVLFTALTAWGRAALGPTAALAPRYTTYSLWAPLALYLVAAIYFRTTLSGRRLLSAGTDGFLAPILFGLAVAAIALQVSWAMPTGIATGQAQRARLEQGVTALRNYRTAPDSELVLLFAPGGGFVKRWAPILQEHGWSVFAGQGS